MSATSPTPGTSQRNTGSPDDKRAAMLAIISMTTVVSTVSTATLAISATFLGDLYQGQSLTALWVGWALLGVSLILGFLVMGQQVNLLAESDLRPRGGTLEVYAFLQLITVLAGFGFLAAFAVDNVTAEERKCKQPIVIAKTVYCPIT
ncbi:hypothetical protein ACFC0D_25450 [Streptomyces sp. NPDC056222]|uniref:hypothetical protein n=1 Tax=Streptomyces sp. NPDC056222 TaxID=3345749 RepID=UPI0035E14560